MPKTYKILPLLGCALFLAACTGDTLPPPNISSRPVIQEMRSLHAVRFAPGSAQISQIELERMAKFFNALPRENGDQVYINLTAGSSSKSLEARRAVTLSQILEANGVSAEVRSFTENPQAATVIAMDRFVAAAPAHCSGAYSKSFSDNYVNGVSSHHGCADSQNLAAMLARPRDLSDPIKPGEAQAERHFATENAYRKGVRDELSDAAESSSGD